MVATDGHTYRIPTKAKWGCLARSGVSSRSRERYGELDAISWHRANSEDLPKPARVGLESRGGRHQCRPQLARVAPRRA